MVQDHVKYALTSSEMNRLNFMNYPAQISRFVSLKVFHAINHGFVAPARTRSRTINVAFSTRQSSPAHFSSHCLVSILSNSHFQLSGTYLTVIHIDSSNSQHVRRLSRRSFVENSHLIYQLTFELLIMNADLNVNISMKHLMQCCAFLTISSIVL